MRRALHAEWTKLRTLPGTGRLVLLIIALSAGVSAGAATTVICRPLMCDYDLPKLSLMGVQAGQAVVVVLAVLAISGEYSTGMIHTTLAAMPRRTGVLAAKAAVLTALTVPAGAVAVLASVLAGRLILPGNGFTPAQGFAPLSPADGPTLRAAIGSVLYLALIALFSLGVATAVRDSATAIGVVFGLLYVLSIVPFMVSDPDLQRLLWRMSPMNAGLAVQATTHLPDLPLSPWAGLGVLGAWTAAALLVAALVLGRRDA